MAASLRPRARAALVGLVAVLVLVGSACQVRVDVAVQTSVEGSGTVRVSVGFDDRALARLGDPTTALRLDDLRQAGWVVTGPDRREDGNTWFSATKAFATVDELDLVLAEVAGPDGPLRDFALTVGETDSADTYRLTGTVDLSPGLDAFADPAVAEALGDPFGGLVAAVEAEEGRPVADMLAVSVTAGVGEQVQVLTPRLGDPPTAVDVTEEVAKPTSVVLWLVAGTMLVTGLAVVLVMARRRFRAGLR